MAAADGSDVGFDSYRQIGAGAVTTSSYVASTAFGANVRVTRLSGRVCGVVFSYCGSAMPLLVKMAPEEARRFPKTPGIAVLGRLKPPYFGLFYDRQTPKVDSPIERNITVDGLQFSPEAIWFFEPATGRVAATFSLQENCRL
jgi:hypothetical protein